MPIILCNINNVQDMCSLLKTIEEKNTITPGESDLFKCNSVETNNEWVWYYLITIEYTIRTGYTWN